MLVEASRRSDALAILARRQNTRRTFQPRLRVGRLATVAGSLRSCESQCVGSQAMNATTPRHRHLRPIRAVVGALLRASPKLRPRIQELSWRGVYEAASFGRRDLITTMNYGYAADGDSAAQLQGDDDRFGLQL